MFHVVAPFLTHLIWIWDVAMVKTTFKKIEWISEAKMLTQLCWVHPVLRFFICLNVFMFPLFDVSWKTNTHLSLGDCLWHSVFCLRHIALYLPSLQASSAIWHQQSPNLPDTASSLLLTATETQKSRAGEWGGRRDWEVHATRKMHSPSWKEAGCCPHSSHVERRKGQKRKGLTPISPTCKIVKLQSEIRDETITPTLPSLQQYWISRLESGVRP